MPLRAIVPFDVAEYSILKTIQKDTMNTDI